MLLSKLLSLWQAWLLKRQTVDDQAVESTCHTASVLTRNAGVVKGAATSRLLTVLTRAHGDPKKDPVLT